MASPKFCMTKALVATLWGMGLFSPAYSEITPLQSQQDTLSYEDVQRFSIAIGQIKSFYVNPVDDSKLFENAIRGMLTGLDPHSAYLDTEEFLELKNQTEGEFGGLGLEVGLEEDYIRVISPIDDTPAAQAGVRAGDIIVKLNETPVRGMGLREAVNLMRGPKGSKISLTIVRKGEKQLLQLTLMRDMIAVNSVKSRLIENDYGYLRISHFQTKTLEHLQHSIAVLNKLNKQPLRGVVLDLRNNPGGLLDSAIEVSDAFLDGNKLQYNKLIVYTKGRIANAEIRATASPGDILKGIPLVVLINQGSASGSEIVAGALQDHKRAVIMGNTSFGKGSVQTVLPLDETRGVKLTTALYYTPRGRSIQAEGIKPDIIVEEMKVSTNEDSNNLVLTLIRESDLERHLDNGNTQDRPATADAVNTQVVNQGDNQSLAVQDYQLHEALNLLKALNVVSLGKHGR